jgi:hemerythrin superfamily protein
MKQIVDKLSPSVANVIRADHTRVMATFHQFEAGKSPEVKRALVNTACLALEIHAQAEEEIFYPALRAVSVGNGVLDKSVPEHDQMRQLISKLRGMEPVYPLYDQTFNELMRCVMHHVADEETELLPNAERLLPDRLGELGAQMMKRRVELMAPRAKEIATNTVRALSANSLLVAGGAVLAGIAGTYLGNSNLRGMESAAARRRGWRNLGKNCLISPHRPHIELLCPDFHISRDPWRGSLPLRYCRWRSSLVCSLHGGSPYAPSSATLPTSACAAFSARRRSDRPATPRS